MEDLQLAQPVERTSSFAEQVIKIGDDLFLLGDLFQHFQHMLTPREEAVIGMRCCGYSRLEIANLVGLGETGRIRQTERQAINHIILLYRQGK